MDTYSNDEDDNDEGEDAYAGHVVDDSSDQSTLSERQGLTTTAAAMVPRIGRPLHVAATSARLKMHVHVPPAAVATTTTRPSAMFACVICGHVASAREMKKCGGGCPGHYLCSTVCRAADWYEYGHYRACLRGASKE